jgi:hypothetical protein
VLLRKLVVIAVPFSWIVEPLANAVPDTCRLTEDAPCVRLLGEIEVIVGSGTGLTENWNGTEDAALGAGLDTTMVLVPVAVRSEAGMVAMICVAVWLTIVSWVELNFIVAPDAKFCPVAETLIGPVLTMALDGLTRERVGGMGLMVNAREFDVSDSGVGSTTVTDAAPVTVRLAAGTVATSWVAEFKTVVSDTPLN